MKHLRVLCLFILSATQAWAMGGGPPQENEILLDPIIVYIDRAPRQQPFYVTIYNTPPERRHQPHINPPSTHSRPIPGINYHQPGHHPQTPEPNPLDQPAPPAAASSGHWRDPGPVDPNPHARYLPPPQGATPFQGNGFDPNLHNTIMRGGMPAIQVQPNPNQIYVPREFMPAYQQMHQLANQIIATTSYHRALSLLDDLKLIAAAIRHHGDNPNWNGHQDIQNILNELDQHVEQLRQQDQSEPAPDDTPRCERAPVPYTFQSPAGPFRETIENLYQALYTACPTEPNKQLARELGLASTEKADESFAHQEQGEANAYKMLAESLYSMVIGTVPLLDAANTAYEVITGKNFITGRELSHEEIVLSAVSFSAGKIFQGAHKGYRALNQIYAGARRRLHDARIFNRTRPAIDQAGHQIERARDILTDWGKGHRITGIEPAHRANVRARVDQPPYLPGTHVVYFETGGSSKFVRVHGLENHRGGWMVKESEIRGLTPQQIRDKLNLPITPTHFTTVNVPPRTQMSRGMTNYNEWPWHGQGQAIQGQVQYRIESRWEPHWFSEPTAIGERLVF